MTHNTSPGPAGSEISRAETRLRRPAGFGRDEAPAVTANDAASLKLLPVFTPAQAAEVLQALGLPEMTECALRTRAYRRQIPFHLNGRRIRFTVDDLREIAEGQARRPRPRPASARPPATQLPAQRRSPSREAKPAPVTWRARGSRDKPAAASKGLR